MKPAGTQNWRDLLFLHWAYRPEVVRRALALPDGLELHHFDRQAWIGVVAFAMHGVRPARWWPGKGMAFLETNLRTYVSYRGGPPAVWFLSLEAASTLAVKGARASWGLPYHRADMQYGRESGGYRYRTVRRGKKAFAAFEAEWTISGTPEATTAGTLDHFLVEQYELVSARGRKLLRGRVKHEPYRVQPVELMRCSEDLAHHAGLPPTEGPPVHACFSPGVDVEVFGPERID